MPEQTSPVPSESKASAPGPSTGKSQGKLTQRLNSRVAVISLVISLALLITMIVVGWYGYKNIWPVLSSGTLASQSWVNDQLINTSENLEDLVGRSEQRLLDIGEQSERLISRVDGLDSGLKQLQGADQSGWLVAEANYLLRLANQRLLVSRDLNSADTLLTQVDVLLRSVDDYGLFHVRQVLAEDIAAVRGTPRVDNTTVWLELNGIAKQIDVLPVISDRPVPGAAAKDSTGEKTSPTPADTEVAPTAPATGELDSIWQQLINFTAQWSETLTRTAGKIAQTFANQFQIRKIEAVDIPVLLSPDQELFLRQNLSLMIEQAKTALLQGRSGIYRASLEQTEAWLNRWFINSDQSMMAIMLTLERLKTVPVEQKVPDIRDSLTALKRYQEEKTSPKSPIKSVDSYVDENGGQR